MVWNLRSHAAILMMAVSLSACATTPAAVSHEQRTQFGRVRVSAAEALVKIGPGLVVPSMIEALKSPDVATRANAAVVLGAFGPPAQPAVPALARALKDANPRVRELAGQALDRIGSTWPSQPVTFPLNCH